MVTMVLPAESAEMQWSNSIRALTKKTRGYLLDVGDYFLSTYVGVIITSHCKDPIWTNVKCVVAFSPIKRGPRTHPSGAPESRMNHRLKKKNIADVERKCVWHSFRRMMPCAKLPRWNCFFVDAKIADVRPWSGQGRMRMGWWWLKVKIPSRKRYFSGWTNVIPKGKQFWKGMLAWWSVVTFNHGIVYCAFDMIAEAAQTLR